ncbi:MAG: hypothetical protein V3W41_00800 [Planctomycetota bacterium]
MAFDRVSKCLRAVSGLLVVLAMGMGLFGSGDSGAREIDDTAAQAHKRSPMASIDAALAAAFRIDIKSIDVSYELDPKLDRAWGEAKVLFRMRPGQSRPLIHFDPLKSNCSSGVTIEEIKLNGERLNGQDPKDLRRRVIGSSAERALEFQRDLAPKVQHELTMRWQLWGCFSKERPGWFISSVDDTIGLGNEVIWPTINSPEELALHRIQVRVRGQEDYLILGSGDLVSTESKDLTVHTLKTPREVSSYTVLLAAIPSQDVQVEEFKVGDTPITLVSTQSRKTNQRARKIVEATLPRLAKDFGKLPVPFVKVLLIDWEDGMEYFGATITGLDSLEHELVHMYWGCTLLLKTWRDTWLDEAIVVWWLERDDLDDLPKNFKSDLVSAQSPIEIAFDESAYDEGAMIMKEVAADLGGDRAMIKFLRRLHQRRVFVPFTTRDFVDDLVVASRKRKLRAKFERWVFGD